MADYKRSVVLHTFMGIVFFISGLFINVLQGVIYVLFYYTNRDLYRKINYYLIYTSWSQIVAMAEWWSGSSCNLYGDKESLAMFGKEHAIVVMNHKYEVDWLMCWFVCDKLGMLGNAKTCAKRSLSFLPVIGWGWVFAEMIFLDRNWDKDKLILPLKLDQLVAYKDPIMILFFCEGTRYTPEKHQASIKFAEERNLPVLKYHLLPRAKGFNFAASHLKDKTNAIYDVQLAFPNDQRPTFYDLMCGKKFVGDMYVRRIPTSEIPTDSDEATTQWLYKLYEKKDQASDDYYKNGTFPGKCIELKRTPYSLLNACFWCFCVGAPILFVTLKFLTSGVLWLQITMASVIVLAFIAMHMMIGVTKAAKGSSYGMTEKPPSTKSKETLQNGGCSSNENSISPETANSHLENGENCVRRIPHCDDK